MDILGVNQSVYNLLRSCESRHLLAKNIYLEIFDLA